MPNCGQEQWNIDIEDLEDNCRLKRATFINYNGPKVNHKNRDKLNEDLEEPSFINSKGPILIRRSGTELNEDLEETSFINS